MLASFFRPLLSTPSALISSIFASQIRFTSKTHRATYKRWRKTADSYKRGKQGRKHGNAGFSQRVLGKRTGTAYATHTQALHLKKLLPHL